MLNIKTGECLKRFEHSNMSTGYAGTLHDVKIIDHSRIITCSENNVIEIWEVETGECLKTIESDGVFQIEVFSIDKIAFIGGLVNDITVMSKAGSKHLNGRLGNQEDYSIKKFIQSRSYLTII